MAHDLAELARVKASGRGEALRLGGGCEGDEMQQVTGKLGPRAGADGAEVQDKISPAAKGLPAQLVLTAGPADHDREAPVPGTERPAADRGIDELNSGRPYLGGEGGSGVGADRREERG